MEQAKESHTEAVKLLACSNDAPRAVARPLALTYIDGMLLEDRVPELLRQATAEVAVFLERTLPGAGATWWENCVLPNLSPHQRRRASAAGEQSLDALDLASLLRVVDRNWYQVSGDFEAPREARHFLKELQTVRNRWAHADSRGITSEDAYRDLDTLQRFSQAIRADRSLISYISDAKNAALDNAQEEEPKRQSAGDASAEQEHLEIEVGSIVCLRSDPSTRGAVISVSDAGEEARYGVFLDGAEQTFYASQISQVRAESTTPVQLDHRELQAYLTGLQVRHPSAASLYSLNSARVSFIPYQYRPVLKFIRSDRPRLLLADSVGVGKTIEAGLILRELEARRDIDSILVVCPRPLVVERKWEIEMKRFGTRLVPLDGPSLRMCLSEMDLEGEWPEQYRKIILPYSLFDEDLLYGTKGTGKKKRKGLLELDPPPRFDLVIVDEAHHIRNPATNNHRVVTYFCDHAEAVLFLTATPIQTSSEDLYVLLNALRPDLVIDKRSFEHMTAPNEHINMAAVAVRTQAEGWQEVARDSLGAAARTAWGRAVMEGSPRFIDATTSIRDPKLSADARVKLIDDIERLHTLDGLLNRTRRRDIGEFTIRKPQTVEIPFTVDQQQLHDDLLNLQKDIYRAIHGDQMVMFLLSTIRRQAASCIFGLVPLLEDILSRQLDSLGIEEGGEPDSEPIDNRALSAMEPRARKLLVGIKGLAGPDPKLEALRQLLAEKKNSSNRRVMLFSSFLHTLRYLHRRLTDVGFRVGLVYGQTSDVERIELRERFALDQESDSALDVLLFSEIGCEGLDYQFCDCIVNYDLPWNPMRIEQRIGRIDRWGQQSEAVSIVNLITPGTVDADIYERCLARIGLFESSIGGNEEILSEITSELKAIGEDLSLSADERRQKLEQLTENKIRLMREQSELEERQTELFAIRLPQEQHADDVRNARNPWLAPQCLLDLVSVYLSSVCGDDHAYILGGGALKTLRLSREARQKLLHDLRATRRQNSPAYRDWETWLKGSEPHLEITFDAGCAMDNPHAVLLSPVHPLVRQAVAGVDSASAVISRLATSDSDLPAGEHAFAVYQWQYRGIREDSLLCPIAECNLDRGSMERIIRQSDACCGGVDQAPDLSGKLEGLERRHHALWSEARDLHKEETRAMVLHRQESLRTSHSARINLLRDQLEEAGDEKIARMRRAQIESAEADFARHMQELDIAVERADVVARLVAYGTLTAKPDEPK